MIAPRLLSLLPALATAAALVACGGGEDEAAEEPAAAVDVSIADFMFLPETVTLEPGGTVTFTNEDTAAHTAETDEGAPAEFDTGTLVDDDNVGEVTLEEPGTYEYLCNFHPYMQATVEVVE